MATSAAAPSLPGLGGQVEKFSGLHRVGTTQGGKTVFRVTNPTQATASLEREKLNVATTGASAGHKPEGLAENDVLVVNAEGLVDVHTVGQLDCGDFTDAKVLAALAKPDAPSANA